jgi:hypothetical protein
MATQSNGTTGTANNSKSKKLDEGLGTAAKPHTTTKSNTGTGGGKKK